MSGTKAALKAAKVALDGQKYDEAVTQAQTVLSLDKQNYFA
jgi:superkiller protein 3